MDRENSIAVLTRGLRKRFGGNGASVEALRGVDFQARVGELTFNVCPSGCCKTTLLSVISALIYATVGENYLFVQGVHLYPPHDTIEFPRQYLVFVFNHVNL